MREYVSQFREYLTEKKAVSQNTLQSYMRDIQHFLTFMKEHQFTDLLKADDTMMHLYVEELTRQIFQMRPLHGVWPPYVVFINF